MAAMVRLQAVRGYRELVAELGGDPTRLLRTARIKVSAFEQPATFISFGGMIDLLERSARDLDCPDFGFRLAEHQDIGILGPLAVAIRSSATVGDAAQCASKYLYVHNPAISFTVRPDEPDDQAQFVFEILSEHAPPCAQMIEHGVGVTARILSMLAEGVVSYGRSRCPIPGSPLLRPTEATLTHRSSSTLPWQRWRSIGARWTCH